MYRKIAAIAIIISLMIIQILPMEVKGAEGELKKPIDNPYKDESIFLVWNTGEEGTVHDWNLSVDKMQGEDTFFYAKLGAIGGEKIDLDIDYHKDKSDKWTVATGDERNLKGLVVLALFTLSGIVTYFVIRGRRK